MKKTIFLLIILGIPLGVLSQEQQAASENTLKRIESAKSGNLVDAFGGLYQLALKSVDANEKSIGLNSTLFSLVKNYDANALVTKSRSDIVFLRNFQVNVKINLNEQYRFNGYSAGFTYALLNKRDKGFIDIDNTVYATHLNHLNGLVNAAVAQVVINEMAAFAVAKGRAMNAAELKQLGDHLTEINTAIKNGHTVDPSLQPLFDASLTELDAQISGDAYFAGLQAAAGGTLSNAAEVNDYLATLKSNYLETLEKKPFLSIASDGITDKQGKLNRGAAAMVFLVGNRFGELDARANFEYADTLAVSAPRSILNGKLGYNFKVINKDEKSFFEIKAYGEYVKVLKNALPDEKAEVLLLNADFRVRLTDDLWVPLTIKYDPEDANFLGLLNVTYSFGS